MKSSPKKPETITLMPPQVVIVWQSIREWYFQLHNCSVMIFCCAELFVYRPQTLDRQKGCVNMAKALAAARTATNIVRQKFEKAIEVVHAKAFNRQSIEAYIPGSDYRVSMGFSEPQKPIEIARDKLEAFFQGILSSVCQYDDFFDWCDQQLDELIKGADIAFLTGFRDELKKHYELLPEQKAALLREFKALSGL